MRMSKINLLPITPGTKLPCVIVREDSYTISINKDGILEGELLEKVSPELKWPTIVAKILGVPASHEVAAVISGDE